MSKVLLEIKDRLAYVTINRPASLNCFDYETLCQLQETVERLHVDSQVHVVMITGAGEKAFCAGADLKERKGLTESEVRRNVRAIQAAFQAIEDLPQPTIAAVNGYCFGGGMELMLACDFAFAAQHATMGLTETSWAIIPGAGGTQRLPRRIGEMKAKELIFTAKRISAMEAYDLGLVLRITDKDSLNTACTELAESIMSNGPIAVRQAKFAINHGLHTDLQTGLALEAKAYELTISTADRMEALTAFGEKRAPNFTGT
ncbi:enoyl-CoA hydratase [Ornithinibacillus gellani]|uniref:enoyl-CoA hydratase-related protein n=1 Tax=Ornithinibacillus gellani TaxID=2293253 RepID=UPI000F47DC76|nr:enoyl-CoA hydratase-related protein [Ornithinibacillus gellani]TQS72012.1 enoyl-CoA hydratase [Ornithinibacillus gellani]